MDASIRSQLNELVAARSPVVSAAGTRQTPTASGQRRDAAEHVYCVALGMPYNQMLTTLRMLGINPSNYKVLKVLPLVYQSWIAGKMSQERELRLVDLARLHFGIGADGEEILRGWLRHCPNIADFKEGLNDILVLAHAPYESAFEVDGLPGLLAYAEALGRTTAETMHAPILASVAEEQALADIAREFGVDDGHSWGALVRELRAAN